MCRQGSLYYCLLRAGLPYSGQSEFSRSRLGVGVRWGWSTPSSGKMRCRPTGVRSPDASTVRTGGRFTNTAVPKFDGDGCWQQHLQIFSAIAKSNGWADETAALQLFAHLEGGGGGAHNVPLLMPKGSMPTVKDFHRVSRTIISHREGWRCSEENLRV